MKKSLFTFVLAMLALNCFAGDILTLKNEKSFVGKIVKIQDCSVVFKAEGQKYVVPAAEISSLQFENPDSKIYTNFMTMSQQDPNICLGGKMDAQVYHGKKGGHFVLGVLFGPIAIIGTLLSNPTPYKGKETLIMSKNSAYFTDPMYLQCYKKQAKKQLIGMEALGWGAIVLVSLIL